MHGVALAHQDALAAIVGDEGVVAVALALEDAVHDVRAYGATVVALAVGGQVVVGHEVLQGIHDHHLEGVVDGLEGGEEFLDAEVPVGLRGEDIHQHAVGILFLEASRGGGAVFLIGFSHSGKD